RLLSMFAPYTAEDMWALLGHEATVALEVWPQADLSLTVEQEITVVVQVDGKVRDKLTLQADVDESTAETAALASEKVQRAVDGREIARVIVRLPKIVNIATVQKK